MKTLQIEESKARSIYRTASQEFKSMLEDTFGKEFFSQDVTERIKNYSNVCEELGIPFVSEKEMIERGFTEDEAAYRMLKNITRALNEGWEPDWSDGNQKKHYPYFYMSGPSGFAFGSTNYYYSFANAGGGSRLCFKSEKLAAFAGKRFLEVYKRFML